MFCKRSLSYAPDTNPIIFSLLSKHYTSTQSSRFLVLKHMFHQGQMAQSGLRYKCLNVSRIIRDLSALLVFMTGKAKRASRPDWAPFSFLLPCSFVLQAVRQPVSLWAVYKLEGEVLDSSWRRAKARFCNDGKLYWCPLGLEESAWHPRLHISSRLLLHELDHRDFTQTLFNPHFYLVRLFISGFLIGSLIRVIKQVKSNNIIKDVFF